MTNRVYYGAMSFNDVVDRIRYLVPGPVINSPLACCDAATKRLC